MTFVTLLMTSFYLSLSGPCVCGLTGADRSVHGSLTLSLLRKKTLVHFHIY